MTSKKETMRPNSGQSKDTKLKRLFATVIWLALAPLLTNCGSSSAKIAGVPPGPPAVHNNAWLSYKLGRGCGPFSNLNASCTELGKAGFDDSSGLSEASKYYCSIGVDPNDCGVGKTPQYAFSQWKLDNGFPSSGFPPAHAFYYNQGDLQLGRDMNCVQSGQNIACYVSNYGPPPFLNGAENPAWPDPDNAVSAAVNQTLPGDPSGFGLFATVAMVFNPNGFPNGDLVTFYVFVPDPNDPTHQNEILANNAALDGEGAKSVPRMCMACHGGAYTDNTNTQYPYNSKAPGINFLPFDMWFFQYSPNAPLSAQQEGFRQLNQLVRLTHAQPNPQAPYSDNAIVESIDVQYNTSSQYQSGQCGNQNLAPCVNVLGAQVPRDPPPPSGWSSNPNLYAYVFRPYCRMCHLGQSYRAGNPADLTFDSFISFPAPEIQTLACSSHDMPHAEVPLGGQAGSKSKLKTGLWWDLLALDDLNAFISNSGVPNPTLCQ